MGSLLRIAFIVALIFVLLCQLYEVRAACTGYLGVSVWQMEQNFAGSVGAEVQLVNSGMQGDGNLITLSHLCLFIADLLFSSNILRALTILWLGYDR